MGGMRERIGTPWRGWPHAPAPMALFAPRGENADHRPVEYFLVDDAGRPIVVTAWTRMRELMRHAWLLFCTTVLRALAALVVPRRAPPVRREVPGPGPVVLVLPVLPDVSHTFVYREVLALLRQRPDWCVVALDRNDQAPVHDEVTQLLGRTTFLRRDGITAAARRALRWLLRARGRELFALYRAEPGGRAGDLLGKLPLRDPRHPGNAFALADQLAALRPRHVHVYASTYPANVALGAARLLGVPASISSYVDFEFPYAHKMLAAKLAQAAFFRVVTDYCRQRLLALPEAAASTPERVPVVLLGLDLANWQQRAASRGDGTIVTAARLVPKKGLHVVPEALALLRARGVRCRWRVIGDGPERESLQRACAQRGVQDLVDFLGARDNGFVRSELLTADAALLPCVIAADGERDGIPVFLCEAMAFGVPVVTTPVSGIPELVRDRDTGFLCAAGDSVSLATALAAVLADPAEARRVAERGRALVQRVLDVDTLAGELISRIEA